MHIKTNIKLDKGLSRIYLMGGSFTEANLKLLSECIHDSTVTIIVLCATCHNKQQLNWKRLKTKDFKVVKYEVKIPINNSVIRHSSINPQKTKTTNDIDQPSRDDHGSYYLRQYCIRNTYRENRINKAIET